MAKLVGETKDIIFLAPLIEEKIVHQPRYVYGREKRNGETVFAVQLSISGTQRELGEFSDLEPALRFADMATLRFRKYRRNSVFNYSEAQAVADTANDEDNGGKLAIYILSRQENVLRAGGNLSEVSRSAPINPVHRRTAKSVLSRLAVLEAVVVSLQNELKISVIVPPIIITDPIIPAPAPIFYPTVISVNPKPPAQLTLPTIWKQTSS